MATTCHLAVIWFSYCVCNIRFYAGAWSAWPDLPATRFAHVFPSPLAGVVLPVARVRAVAAFIAVCCLGAVLLAPAARAEQLPGVEAPATATVHEFDLPAQDLASALDQYQTITRQSALYETQLVRGKTSTTVRGRFTPRQALSKLLQGTGLTAEVVNERSVMLKRSTVRRPLTATEQALAERRYDGQTQQRLTQALCAHPALQAGKHRMVLRYWIDDDGRIERLKVRIAAAPALEAGVRAALLGTHVGLPPAGVSRSAVVLVQPQTDRKEACQP